MAADVVVDASALLKLALAEPDSAAFSQWFQRALRRGTRLMAPALIEAETGRALQREAVPAATRAPHEVHADLLRWLSLEAGGDPTGVWALAERLDYFDATYVALAREAGALVTADKRMAAVARSLGVKIVGPRPKS